MTHGVMEAWWHPKPAAHEEHETPPPQDEHQARALRFWRGVAMVTTTALCLLLSWELGMFGEQLQCSSPSLPSVAFPSASHAPLQPEPPSAALLEPAPSSPVWSALIDSDSLPPSPAEPLACGMATALEHVADVPAVTSAPSSPAPRVESCLSLWARNLVVGEWIAPQEWLPPVNNHDMAHVMTGLRMQLSWRAADRASPVAPLPDMPTPTRSTFGRAASGLRLLRAGDESWTEIEADVAKNEAQVTAEDALDNIGTAWETEAGAAVRARWMHRCQLLPLFELPAPAADASEPDLSHLEFLRGQWMLLLGDSTDRYMARFACEKWSFEQQGPASPTGSVPSPGVRDSRPNLQPATPGMRVRFENLKETRNFIDSRLCSWASLNFSIINVFTFGSMEQSPRDPAQQWSVFMGPALRQAYALFERPPLAITMQSLLWDVSAQMKWWVAGGVSGESAAAGLGGSLDTMPVHPLMSWLQNFEHGIVRPLALVFNHTGVLRQSALTSSVASDVYADDPAWPRVAEQRQGRCFVPLPFDDQHCRMALERVQTVAAMQHARVATLRDTLRGLMADTPQWRSGGAPAPLFVLRSVMYNKGEWAARNPSVHLLNGGMGMLARAYALPFMDAGQSPLSFVFDKAHPRIAVAKEVFNYLLNIIRHHASDTRTQNMAHGSKVRPT